MLADAIQPIPERTTAERAIQPGGRPEPPRFAGSEQRAGYRFPRLTLLGKGKRLGYRWRAHDRVTAADPR
ncbi:hypothetical protein ACFPN7_47675 [Amycolatopsis halotolerans]|uniref:hypothetical protein n=1 Tax=Amycolatopsis halotolerans TaxID=330083 RepID=UPI00362380D5